MTTSLETRYRLLLGAYPAEHRRTYEREMIGVLMDGARPGQRFPALGETADLLLAGAGARFGRGRQALRSYAWRDAAAVFGLLGAVALTAVAGRRLIAGLINHFAYEDPMRAFGLNGALVFDVALRSVVWLAVVIALLAGARRLAAYYAGVATLVEFAGLAWWQQPNRVIMMSWLPVLALLVVGSLFVAARGRSAASVMGRRAMTLAVAGTALAAGVQFMAVAGLPYAIQSVLHAGRFGPGSPSFVQVILAAPLLWALWTLDAPVRGRVLALAIPVLIMPTVADAVSINFGIGPNASQVILLIVVPSMALFWAVQALRWRERRPSASN